MDTPDSSPFAQPEVTGKMLNQQYHWMRASWPLLVAVAGLALLLAGVWLVHPSYDRVVKWGRLPAWWSAGGMSLLVFCTLLWFFRHRSLLKTARHLDVNLSAKNRLETATTLRGAEDPMARAQREETARFLQRTAVRPPKRRLELFVALSVVLVLAHFLTLLVWTRPWVRPVSSKATASPTPAAVPKASITWKSPESEAKAASVEEVPLEAVAESTSGLRDLSLEISVNGEHRQSVPLPIGEFAKPGCWPVTASLYLDQVAVEPYDMVSYYLRAQRITPTTVPPATVSPVQFVEIKPFRADIKEGQGGLNKSGFPLIVALKVAQLRLLKENFFLAHADLAPDTLIWLKENKRVGDEQALLGTKTGEVIQKLIAEGAPATIVDLLSQAKPLMGQASEKIAGKENSEAAPLQSKSLGLITEIEKFFIRYVAHNGSSERKEQNVTDPFQKQREVELKQRNETPAGELELLAKEQLRLSIDLDHARDTASGAGKNAPSPSPMPVGKPSNSNRFDGTLAERQALVSQRLAALLNQTGPTFSAEVLEHLDKAHAQSKEALQQLDAEDIRMARGPAANAAHELKLALETMNKGSEQEIKDVLASTLRTLNQAGADARDASQAKSDREARDAAAKAAEKVERSRQKLAEEAKKQQETGSADAAKRLASAAATLNDSKLREDMKKLHDHPRDSMQANRVAEQLSAAADQIARAPGAERKSPEEIAQLIERMERSSANMKRLAAIQRNGDEPGSGRAPGGSSSNSQRNDASQVKGPDGAAAASSKASGDVGQEEEPALSPGREGVKEERERFSKELIEDFRQEVAEAELVLPTSPEIQDVHKALREDPHNYADSLAQVTALAKIGGPLDSLIALLRAQLQQSQRQQKLDSQGPAKAPEGYRDAVADYFERLSRDYKASPQSEEAKSSAE